MRIGVISDTHITNKNQTLPRKVLQDFATVDMVIHAGDLVDITVLKQLESVCKNVHAVWGNMDPQEVKKILPQKQIIDAGGHRIGIMHGYGSPSGLKNLLADAFKNDKVDIIVFGHSHFAVNEFQGGILYFNPGSATDKVFASYNSYGILTINDKVEAKIIKL